MTLRTSLTSLLALALLLAFTASAVADPHVGDQVIYHTTPDEDRTALVAAVVSGTTIDLVAFSDGDDYGDGNPGSQPAAIYRNVPLGASSGQYSTGTSVAATVSDVLTGLGLLQAPNGVSGSGLTLGGAGVQLSATRPVMLVVRGTASLVSTLSGGQAYALELRCDTGTTPTTVVDDAAGSVTQSLGLSVTLTELQPWKLVALRPAGDRCRVVQASGAGTVTISGATAQEL